MGASSSGFKEPWVCGLDHRFSHERKEQYKRRKAEDRESFLAKAHCDDKSEYQILLPSSFIFEPPRY
ncbi:MAG TPA: hypothetical protein DEA32_01100 [Firmicutes bacterium]|mgnify:CR=1 FL=1|nr:hypothetical protein [Bacillota bacterium]